LEKFHEIEGLNNRELALVIWLGALFIFVMILPKWRKHLDGLMTLFFDPKIFISYLLSVAYTVIGIWILYRLDWWSVRGLKDILLWCTIPIVRTLFKMNEAEKDSDYFKKVLLENLKFTLILEFVTETYTFSLPTELIIWPVLVVIGFMQAASAISPAYKKVATFFGFLATTYGLLLLGHAVYEIIKDYHSIANLEKLQDFSLPPLLSIWFLPWMYVLSLWVRFEAAFIMVKMTIKNKRLYRYALRKAFMAFVFDREGLERWRKHIGLHDVNNKRNIRASIRHIETLETIEKDPPPVERVLGWSPYKAKDYLMGKGIATRYYENVYDEEYAASSPYMPLREEFTDNHTSYYVTGTKKIAKELQISLAVNNTAFEKTDLATMQAMCAHLYYNAIGNDMPDILNKSILQKENVLYEEETYLIELKRNDYQNHTGQYNYTFTITFTD
jgi:hypothetical protein